MLNGLILSLLVVSGSKGTYIDQAFQKAATTVGVPVNLLRAVCWAESLHKADAYRHQDGGDKNHAFGICQVVYSTAKGMGFKDLRCEQDFKTNDIPKNYKDGCKLFGPYTNAYYAAKYLKSRLEKYNNSWVSAIASYNTGSLKICKTGKVFWGPDKKVIYHCEVGGLLNQRYVDRVIKAFEEGR